MSAQEIQGYIDRINSNTFHDTIFIRPLNKHVLISRVWDDDTFQKKEIKNKHRAYHIFFIKNEHNFVIGAVLDMTHDLHWYITPKFRKKGYLTRALKEAIIPYIFCNEFNVRDKQEISIKRLFGDANYNASKRVAESIGFKPINNYETLFLLQNRDFDWSNHNETQTNTLVDKERLQFLKSKLNFIKLNFQMLNDELTMKCNDNSLQTIINELEEKSITSIIEYGNSVI